MDNARIALTILSLSLLAPLALGAVLRLFWLTLKGKEPAWAWGGMALLCGLSLLLGWLS
jgi:hypothetical protein